MKKIEVSNEVWDAIAVLGKFGETEDDVLKRVFKIETSNNTGYLPLRTRGLLPPERTKCKFNYKGNDFDGIIINGNLEISGLGKFTSFSAASGGVTNTSRDGWYDWYLQLPGGLGWIIADEWRKKYSAK